MRAPGVFSVTLLGQRVLRAGLAAALGAALGACQTTGPARDGDIAGTAVDFKRPKDLPPRRTIDDLTRRIRRPARASPSCAAGEQVRRDLRALKLAATLDTSKSFRTDVVAVRDALEIELAKGHYETGMELARYAIRSTADQRIAGDFWAQLGRIHASIGEVEAARSARESAQRAWGPDAGATRTRYLDILLQADIALATGNVEEAGRLYNDAIELLREGRWSHRLDRARGAGNWKDPIEFDWVYAGMARVSLGRGDLADAERWARKAVIGRYGKERYSSRTAAEISRLARILVEQGRLDEAAALTRLAIDMHEYRCAPPELLSHTQARMLAARLKAADGDWAGAIGEFGAVERALAKDPDTFLTLYGASFEWIMALIETGQAQRANERLAASLPLIEARHGTDSYAHAEATGLYGIALHATSSTARALAASVQLAGRDHERKRAHHGNLRAAGSRPVAESRRCASPDDAEPDR